MYEVEVKVAVEHGSVRDRLPAAAEALGTVEQVDTYFDAPHRDFAETDEALRLRRERRLSEGARVGTANDADAGAAEDQDAGAADNPDAEAADEADAGDGDEPDAGDGDAQARGWTTAITYKGPLVEAESKTREEFETLVAEGEELEAVLERLGFEPAAEVRKERERYSVGELVVSLDTVEGLGEFVEVETEVESEGDIESEDETGGVSEGESEEEIEGESDGEVNGSGGSRPKDGTERPTAIVEARDAALSLLADLGCAPDEQIRTSYLGLLLEAE